MAKEDAQKKGDEPEEETAGGAGGVVDPDQIDAAFDTGPTAEERAKKSAEDALEAKKKRLFAELGRLFGGKPAKLLYAFNIAVENRQAQRRLDENGNLIMAAKSQSDSQKEESKQRSASATAADK